MSVWDDSSIRQFLTEIQPLASASEQKPSKVLEHSQTQDFLDKVLCMFHEAELTTIGSLRPPDVSSICPACLAKRSEYEEAICYLTKPYDELVLRMLADDVSTAMEFVFDMRTQA